MASHAFGAVEVSRVTGGYRRLQGAILVRIAKRRRLIYVHDSTIRRRSHMYAVMAVLFAGLLVGTAVEQAFRWVW